MNPKYNQVAQLLSDLIIIEMTAMRQAAVAAQSLENEDLTMGEYVGLQSDKCVNLRTARDNIEAIAAGYAGFGYDGGEEPVVRVTAHNSADDQTASVMEGILGDLIKGGVGVMRIDPSQIFKGNEPKTPSPENKAQNAAREAGLRGAAGTSDA